MNEYPEEGMRARIGVTGPKSLTFTNQAWEQTFRWIRLIALALCLVGPAMAHAGPVTFNWEDNGGVDDVFAGGATITFAPVHVQSFTSVSTSGYWTNLVDTTNSSLRAEIRVRVDGVWQTVAYNDHVRGSYGSAVDLLGSDFVIIPNDLSSGLMDGILIGPNSVIFSGLGGLNDSDGTNFTFTAVIPEPGTFALVFVGLALLAGASGRSTRKHR